MAYSYLTHLECSNCGKTHMAEMLQTVCRDCGKVLLARYDLKAIGRAVNPEMVARRPATLWRYHELLPVQSPEAVVSLGEGMTPLLPLPTLGAALGCPRLLVKDESLNPTGSFKARGMAVAVSRAKELGATVLAIPSAGNAAAAMAAYAARGGLQAKVAMPRDTPPAMIAECVAYGADVTLVDGLIDDCGKLIRERSAAEGWFDISTLKEPYRAEGKKTMGLELAEQLGWRVPDVIIYPTGGGTGIVGMWKAFDELEAMGLIGSKRPRMIVVQAANCAPLVRAFELGERHAAKWENATTVAPGMRVPVAIADYLILDAVRASGGTARTVSDEAMIEAVKLLAAIEGLLVSPEAGATVAMAQAMVADGTLDPDEEVVLFATGSGLKHPDIMAEVGRQA